MIRRPQRRFTVGSAQKFSYKDTGLLVRFVTEQGSIIPRSETGLSRSQQLELTTAIKRARHLAMLPFTQTVQ